jgi:hypothetical protein
MILILFFAAAVVATSPGAPWTASAGLVPARLAACVFTTALMFTPACRTSQHAQLHESILQEKGAIRLLFVDASTSQPIANTDVDVGEAVVCRKSPCAPVVLWTHKSDSHGVVQLPRTVLTDHMLVGTRAHVAREVGVASWNQDQQVWTIELIANPAMICSQPGVPWAVLVAADGQSAEVKTDGRALQFGVLHCTQEPSADVFRACYTEDVADAGYRALFSRTEDNVSVRLQTESIVGATDRARLACATIPK